MCNPGILLRKIRNPRISGIPVQSAILTNPLGILILGFPGKIQAGISAQQLAICQSQRDGP